MTYTAIMEYVMRSKLVKESLKNAVFVIPLKKGIQDLRQKINYKREIY